MGTAAQDGKSVAEHEAPARRAAAGRGPGSSNPASAIIAPGIPSESTTASVPARLGRMWRSMMRHPSRPRYREAVMNSACFTCNTCPRTNHAMPAQAVIVRANKRLPKLRPTTAIRVIRKSMAGKA